MNKSNKSIDLSASLDQDLSVPEIDFEFAVGTNKKYYPDSDPKVVNNCPLYLSIAIKTGNQRFMSRVLDVAGIDRCLSLKQRIGLFQLLKDEEDAE